MMTPLHSSRSQYTQAAPANEFESISLADDDGSRPRQYIRAAQFDSSPLSSSKGASPGVVPASFEQSLVGRRGSRQHSPLLPSSPFERQSSPLASPGRQIQRAASYGNIGRYSIYSNGSRSSSVTNIHAPPTDWPITSPMSSPRLSQGEQRQLTPTPSPRLLHRQFSASNLTLPFRTNSSPLASPTRDSRIRRSSSGYLVRDTEDSPKIPLRKPPLRGERELKADDESVKSMDSDRSADDVEVPQDIIFWNVPLTPGAGEKSLSSSPAKQRTSYFPSSRDSRVMAAQSSPMPRRTSTWESAMSNLSTEAKDLTVALEQYRETKEIQSRQKMRERRSRQDSASKSASDAKAYRPVILPHVPTTDEELAVDSMTRPASLPRKTKEEEEKHLREFRRMLKLSQEAERKKRAKLQTDVKAYLKKQKENYKYWDTAVSPHLQAAISEAKVRDAVWSSGIPAKYREKMWIYTIGNSLAVNDREYIRILKELREDDEKKAIDEVTEAIFADANSTLPETKLFQNGSLLHEPLTDIVRAYARYNEVVGYVHGMTNVTAGLLLQLSSEQSFTALSNLINRQPLLSFYKTDSSKRKRFCLAFDKEFAVRLSSLHHHFRLSLDIRSDEEYLDAFLIPLFTLHLPTDFITRIWDIIFIELAQGLQASLEKLLTGVILTILKQLQSKLMAMNKEAVLECIGWQAQPLSFVSPDVEVDNIITEIDFIRELKNFMH
ncbi:rab-GTPase-TBC domain-containing protein [Limtongia smithiae]|uniref:rab-GTPase-TBC domain-containing protein n=1 Tax=Limtongia smithiae TaxID=1125753 RepID=UPI0034CD5947